MGVIYVVVSLNEELAPWLDEQGISHPSVQRNNRNPTPSEVLAAVAGIPNCQHKVHRDPRSDHICVDLRHDDGRWTEATMSNVVADDRPCRLSFSKGFDELAIEVLSRCTPQCGTLVLIPDTGDTLTVVP